MPLWCKLNSYKSWLETMPFTSFKHLSLQRFFFFKQFCSLISVQHERTFSCRDQDQNKFPYEKVCDFVTDCQNGADEKDCGMCTSSDTTGLVSAGLVYSHFSFSFLECRKPFNSINFVGFFLSFR